MESKMIMIPYKAENLNLYTTLQKRGQKVPNLELLTKISIV